MASKERPLLWTEESFHRPFSQGCLSYFLSFLSNFTSGVASVKGPNTFHDLYETQIVGLS